jgi:hypothetical protein
MQVIIKPIRALRRAGRSSRAKGKSVQFRKAGERTIVSRHSNWSSAIVARHSPGFQRGRWLSLDLVLRAANRKNRATVFSYWPHYHFHFFDNFLSRPVAALPEQSRPHAGTLFAFRESRTVPPYQAAGRTLLDLSRIGATPAPGRDNTSRHGVISRYFVPQAIKSRVMLDTTNAEVLASAPRRFTLISDTGNLLQPGKRISNRVVRSESAYLPVSRAFVSQGVPAADVRGPNEPNSTSKSSSPNFDSFEAVAKPSAPLDIHKLADEVIQQIDRRIVATRERFGKR